MIIKNSFITPYKIAIFNKKYNQGKCPTCGFLANERHILGWCKQCQYDIIQRHGIVVYEIYKEIIKDRLNDKYEYDRKCIYFEGGFLEKGKVIQTIVKDKWL